MASIFLFFFLSEFLNRLPAEKSTQFSNGFYSIHSSPFPFNNVQQCSSHFFFYRFHVVARLLFRQVVTSFLTVLDSSFIVFFFSFFFALFINWFSSFKPQKKRLSPFWCGFFLLNLSEFRATCLVRFQVQDSSTHLFFLLRPRFTFGVGFCFVLFVPDW